MTKKPASQLTPGPWRVEKEKSPGLIPKTFQVFGGQRNNDKKMFIADCGLHNYSKANARLIAAALKTAAERDRLREINKELLDLAKEALNQLEKMDFSCSANWNGSLKTNVSLLLNAAIAKAEGRVS